VKKTLFSGETKTTTEFILFLWNRNFMLSMKFDNSIYPKFSIPQILFQINQRSLRSSINSFLTTNPILYTSTLYIRFFCEPILLGHATIIFKKKQLKRKNLLTIEWTFYLKKIWGGFFCEPIMLSDATVIF
jgi:hypothetical protein